MDVKQTKSKWGIIMNSISFPTVCRYALLALVIFAYALTMV